MGYFFRRKKAAPAAAARRPTGGADDAGATLPGLVCVGVLSRFCAWATDMGCGDGTVIEVGAGGCSDSD
jgi:hypothetical protein